MKLILFRHAEKKNDGTINPPLTAQGQQQAQKLIAEVTQKKIPRPQILMVSPRLRSQQTFSPLAENLKLKVTVSPLLDERTAKETREDFRRRIQELLALLQMDYPNDECVFLCTHHDWIHEFLTVVECSTDLLQPQFHHWNTCQWMWLNKSEVWDLMKFDFVRP